MPPPADSAPAGLSLPEASRPKVTWQGVVCYLHSVPRAFLPMRSFQSLTLIAGQGIAGDRYQIGRETGFYSHKPEEGRQVTLFEIETLEAILRDYKIEMKPEDHRRNVTVRGVPLNHLVGARFYLGPCLLEATRLSTPCRHIEQILEKQVFDPMLHRCGLNCRILEGGVVHVGDTVRPA